MKARNDFFEKFENNKIPNLSKVLGGSYDSSETYTISIQTIEGTFDTDSACPDCEQDPNQQNNNLIDYYSLDQQVTFWPTVDQVEPLRYQLLGPACNCQP